MASFSLAQTIATAAGRLTPTDRRIAEAVLGGPTLLAFGTVTDLANAIGTSRPSIVRFATRLGFAGYTDLQDQVRLGLSVQLARPTERIRQERRTSLPVRSAIERSIASVFEAAGAGRLTQLAGSIAGARTVWIASGETSRAGAHALLSGLSMVRAGVRLLEDRTIGNELTDVGPGDVAVVFDFFRYRRSVVIAARIMAESGAELIAITDGPLSPLAGLTASWVEIYVPAIGPFDSSLPAVAMAELLVAEVAGLLHDEVTGRIDRTEELWAATQTFHVGDAPA
ncbi:MAG: MurR/RpiR family transcriptional regulator [Chloroflexota bacterium]|nr:MurR/RpiR family transcriptional regulator [Chloroflexota bacterium]